MTGEMKAILRLIVVGSPILGILACKEAGVARRTAPGTAETIPEAGPVAKVIVYRTGRLSLDGKPATLVEIKKRFTELKAKGGSVLYFREDPNAADPPPEAMAVIEAVVAAGLPIRLSSRPDFADSVGVDGKPMQKQP